MTSQDGIIQGPRVFLREMVSDDAPYIVQWRNDPEIMKWMFNQNKLSVESHLKWFHSRNPNRIDYVICDSVDAKPIGTLNYVHNENGEAEAGKMLGNKEYWGKGYAREAFELWMEYGFTHLGFDKIVIYTMATNFGNIKLNEKLGFIEVYRESKRISLGYEVEFIKMEKTL